MELDLNASETQVLVGVLERALASLRHEIHHTDRAAFKAELKADEALLREILAKLRTPMAIGI